MLEMDSLNASLELWDTIAYVALAAVFLGVVGETIVEFELISSWVTPSARKATVGKACALILIAGLGGDITVHAKISEYTGQIIALLNAQAAAANKLAGEANDRAGAANKTAGEANKAAAEANKAAGVANQAAGEANKRAGEADERAGAAHERAAALELLAADLKKKNLDQEKQLTELKIRQAQQAKNINVREITDDQRETFTGSVSGKQRAITLILPDDQEARAYGDERLSPMLKKAGFVVKIEDLGGTSKFSGIIVCDNGAGQLRLLKAFKKARIPARILTKERPEFCGFPAGEEGPIRVFVGQRLASTRN